MIDTRNLAAKFRQRYGHEARFFHAPGRVNLIGDHTDYNDGFVLPMAIDRGTTVAIAVRPDRVLRVWSLNLNESIELNLDALGSGRSGRWGDYVEGVAAALLDKGSSLIGADIALESDISIGGGLSSSAALEMALGTALVSLSNSAMDKLDLAFAGQLAEHRHAGILCGIMDQFTSTHAVRNHALLLDCRSLHWQAIPLRLQEYQFVICDSKVRHSLASSEYNRRRSDCESCVSVLAASLPGIHALRDVTLAQLDVQRALLPDSVLRRGRHVIRENERTLQAAAALAAGNAVEMGKLMSESHASLRDDYEVSCSELDLLVEIAKAQAGVLGARMTGGGFGGCTVNLVKRRETASFQAKLSRDYFAATGLTPDVFAAIAADGARELPDCHFL
jgi:galactokinase